MSSNDVLVIRTFQALGITLSGILAGANISYSLAAIPTMQLPEVPASLAAKQFVKLYNVGRALGVSITISSALCNSFVLYRALYTWPSAMVAGSPPRADVLVAAIVAQVSFVFYTLTFMESGTNKRLFDFERDARHGKLTTELEHKRVRDELTTWAYFNGFRACLPGAGALLGLWAALG